MGKVKSAIITALLIAAMLVLTLFAVISCDVPGTNGVSRYNSFLSSIHLGGEFSGNAYALLYPEGVISVTDYNLVAQDEASDEKQEYESKYTLCDGVYVENDKLENKEEFIASIEKDAEILSKRFGEKGYSDYSVSVENDCAFVIKVSVPTNFTYAAYKNNDATARSNALSEISNTVNYLSIDGDISLRDATDYESSNSLLSVKEDFSTYFKGASYYSIGGNNAVKMTLTKEGFDSLNKILLSSASTDSSDTGSEKSAYIFVGENNFNLKITMGTALESRTLYFQSEASNANDYAIVINSVICGDVLTNSYNDDPAGSGTTIIASSPSFGNYAAVCALVVTLLVIVAAVVASVIRYKKLGLVTALMTWLYALVILLALMIIGIQFTVGVAITAVLGLALLTFSNFCVFEAVRKETLLGRTIQASVKTGYKKTLTTILDLHIALVVAAAVIALACVGELAACGLTFFIAVIASYVLYWFTRLMWYVISSPAKDKFKFCGYKREVFDDEN